MGTLLHGLRSFYWYAGNRKLIWSWASMYILLPFSGGLLAMVFYLIVRGGFMPQSNVGNNNIFAFAALGALVGLFSEEAVLKLKQIAETVFTKSEPGKDAVLPAPKISGVSPAQGPPGAIVTLSGSNFSVGTRVNFGGLPAAIQGVPGKTSLAVVSPAPPHPGKVNVEVINPDGQKDTLANGFEFV